MNMRRSTADNSFDRPLGMVKRSNWTDLLAQVTFTGFLFLVNVGLEPFVSRDSVDAQLISTGEGDVARQISHILAFIIIVSLAFAFRGKMVPRAFPIPLVIVLLWCLVSIGWAIEPAISARRLLLTVIVVSCVMCSVDMLGTQRTLQSLRFVMAVILIVNCVSLFVVPQAVHLPGGVEAELAGDWRGLHSHKNSAGHFAALSALIFLYYGLATRRWRDWLLFVAAVIFMFGTHSKTAIGFFWVCLAISMTYRQMCRTEAGRQLFRYMFIGALLLATVVGLAAYETITKWLDDPSSFTGRVAVWQTVFAYLHDHWLLGAGYSSFWQVGDASPALGLASQRWIQIALDSHSGYLEVFVTIGIVGLFLSIVAFVIIPLKQILDPKYRDVELKSLLLSLVLFVALGNLLETIFLYSDLSEWVLFLVVLAILHQMTTIGISTAKPAPIRNQP